MKTIDWVIEPEDGGFVVFDKSGTDPLALVFCSHKEAAEFIDAHGGSSPEDIEARWNRWLLQSVTGTLH